MQQGLKWNIAHDPCRVGDRTPLGAVPLGTRVHIVLRVYDEAREQVESVSLLLVEGNDSSCFEMTTCGQGYECTLEFAQEPHVAFYHFEIELTDGSTVFYAPCSNQRTTAGELSLSMDALQGFQISLYEPAFATPSWLKGAIMYQVFPDRFARDSNGVNSLGLSYHAAMGRPVFLHDDWDEVLSWEASQSYNPTEFYGGTLQGIREKLPYIASLGVKVLYLNPIFEALSSHRYDTADYESIDPLLGTIDDFEALIHEANSFDIAIVLDAVLSHTGSDSRYFNADKRYDNPGAAQGPESPYYSWYKFTPKSELPYKCWWGNPTLPEVDERNEGWQRYLLGTVLPLWLQAGARGYRLDVADEIPDDVLEKLRTVVKQANPEAAIIGEVWEDATTKESYGAMRTYALGRSLDSVMNYPLREALIDFAINTIDAYHLATFLKLQQSNYPKELYQCLMNLLSSHDVERIRTVLALGEPIRDESRLEQYRKACSITAEQDDIAAQLQVMLAGLIYALPGVPCLYYGDECGMHGGADPFCRAPMTWNKDTRRSDVGLSVLGAYQELGEIRNESIALRLGDMACIALDSDTICIVRTIEEPNQNVLAFANRSSKKKRATLDVKDLSTYTGFKVCLDGCEDGIATIIIPARSTLFIHC